jgi:hypothetical protein
MGERQFEKPLFQPEFEGTEAQRIDELYRLKNQRCDLQAELDCLSVDKEGNKDLLRKLKEMVAKLDSEIRQLEMPGRMV